MDKDQNTDDLVAQALAAIRSVLEPQHVVLLEGCVVLGVTQQSIVVCS